MPGLLSQYFCSTGHVSIVKTLDPVSQMGPCQVGCRVFMLSPSSHLNNGKIGERGVSNEQSIWLSHAWSLFSQSCAENALLQQSGHPGLPWKGVVTSCRVFLVIVYESATQPEEIQGKTGQGDAHGRAFLRLSLLV